MKITPKRILLKTGLEVLLRSASPSDAQNFLEHLRKAHAESYRNLNQSPEYWEKFSVSDEERILLDFESSPSKFILVAVRGDTNGIIGGLGLVGSLAEFTKKSATLGMSIQRDHCGQGLGTELVKYALLHAKQAGFHRVDLTVRTYNSAGITLYEKTGFQRIGLLKDAAYIDGKFVDEYSYQQILN